MTHIEQLHEGIRHIRAVEWQLYQLAGAFERTGNERVTAELTAHAERLSLASEMIDAAFSTELDRGFQQAQQHSATVLEAVLAGIVVGRDQEGAHGT